jgi:hypothetical protein
MLLPHLLLRLLLHTLESPVTEQGLKDQLLLLHIMIGAAAAPQHTAKRLS